MAIQRWCRFEKTYGRNALPQLDGRGGAFHYLVLFRYMTGKVRWLVDYLGPPQESSPLSPAVFFRGMIQELNIDRNFVQQQLQLISAICEFCLRGVLHALPV